MTYDEAAPWLSPIDHGGHARLGAKSERLYQLVRDDDA
jgi:hypothetical protein